MPLPFVSRREIPLTNNDLRVRFDDCEGIMTVDDIESVEQTKRPRHLSVIAKEHLRLHGCSGVQVFLSQSCHSKQTQVVYFRRKARIP